MNENEIQADSNELQPVGEELTNDLADLPVAAEQETSVVAGGGHVKVFDGRNGLSINHNETTADDEEDETDALGDLPVENGEQVKGGPGEGSSTGGGVFLNHNETTVSDEAEDTEEDFFQFADLSLTDEQLAEVKGGPSGGGITKLGSRRLILQGDGS